MNIAMDSANSVKDIDKDTDGFVVLVSGLVFLFLLIKIFPVYSPPIYHELGM